MEGGKRKKKRPKLSAAAVNWKAEIGYHKWGQSKPAARKRRKKLR